MSYCHVGMLYCRFCMPYCRVSMSYCHVGMLYCRFCMPYCRISMPYCQVGMPYCCVSMQYYCASMPYCHVGMPYCRVCVWLIVVLVCLIEPTHQFWRKQSPVMLIPWSLQVPLRKLFHHIAEKSIQKQRQPRNIVSKEADTVTSAAGFSMKHLVNLMSGTRYGRERTYDKLLDISVVTCLTSSMIPDLVCLICLWRFILLYFFIFDLFETLLAADASVCASPLRL